MKPSLRLDDSNWKVFEIGLRSALSLVSGQIYIGNMKMNPGNQASGAPAFIEVPNPVDLMTPTEKDEFITNLGEVG